MRSALVSLLLCSVVLAADPKVSQLEMKLRVAEAKIKLLEKQVARLKAANAKVKADAAKARARRTATRTAPEPAGEWVELARFDDFQSAGVTCSFAGRVTRTRNRAYPTLSAIVPGGTPGRVHTFTATGPWRVRWGTQGAYSYELRAAPVKGGRRGFGVRPHEILLAEGSGTAKGVSKTLPAGAYQLYVRARLMASTVVVEHQP